MLESDDEEAEMESVVRQEEEGSADEETQRAHESDKVSFDWPADNGSVVSGVEEPSEVEEVVDVEEIRVLTVGLRAALRSLDDLNLSEIFQRRAVVMKTVPHFLRGPFRDESGVGGDHGRFGEL